MVWISPQPGPTPNRSGSLRAFKVGHGARTLLRARRSPAFRQANSRKPSPASQQAASRMGHPIGSGLDRAMTTRSLFLHPALGAWPAARIVNVCR